VRETVPVARDSPDCDDASSADNGGIFAGTAFTPWRTDPSAEG
jgi:hypothetical protein